MFDSLCRERFFEHALTLLEYIDNAPRLNHMVAGMRGNIFVKKKSVLRVVLHVIIFAYTCTQ